MLQDCEFEWLTISSRDTKMSTGTNHPFALELSLLLLSYDSSAEIPPSTSWWRWILELSQDRFDEGKLLLWQKMYFHANEVRQDSVATSFFGALSPGRVLRWGWEIEGQINGFNVLKPE